MKFLRCKKCGQIVGVVKDTGVPVICCGETMEELIPHVDEKGLSEKHIPVYAVKKGKCIAKIGMIPHPMTDDHYIEWVALVTNKGNQRKELEPGKSPRAEFSLDEDEVVEEIYAYCNLHQLWKLDLKKNKDCGCNIKTK